MTSRPDDAPPLLASDARRRLAATPATLVHDWLLGMRGGEWVLDALLDLLPTASLATLFYDPEGVTPRINARAVRVSALGRLPGVRRYYRWLLPAFPWAAERLRPDSASRLVLAVSHCAAHAVPAPEGAVHVAYYLSPMRYLYDQHAVYRARGGLAGRALGLVAPHLARWDHAAAQRPDHCLAISHFVARRIERVYDRTAEVIYPPVRTETFRPPQNPRRIDEDLVVSAMAPYKRVDLIVRAANRLGRRLRVVGDGPLLAQIRRLAGPTVVLEGRVGLERLIELYQTRRMLLFAAEEDFGLVPLEAMASGMPVLGLRAGGLTETLIEGRCGAFFEMPETDDLAAAWEAFDADAYDPAALRAHAEQFSRERFLDEMAETLTRTLDQ